MLHMDQAPLQFFKSQPSFSNSIIKNILTPAFIHFLKEYLI
jgi:hypothetical protein